MARGERIPPTTHSTRAVLRLDRAADSWDLIEDVPAAAQELSAHVQREVNQEALHALREYWESATALYSLERTQSWRRLFPGGEELKTSKTLPKSDSTDVRRALWVFGAVMAAHAEPHEAEEARAYLHNAVRAEMKLRLLSIADDPEQQEPYARLLELDLRLDPSLTCAESLKQLGRRVRGIGAYLPQAMDDLRAAPPRQLLEQIIIATAQVAARCPNAEDANLVTEAAMMHVVHQKALPGLDRESRHASGRQAMGAYWYRSPNTSLHTPEFMERRWQLQRAIAADPSLSENVVTYSGKGADKMDIQELARQFTRPPADVLLKIETNVNDTQGHRLAWQPASSVQQLHQRVHRLANLVAEADERSTIPRLAIHLPVNQEVFQELIAQTPSQDLARSLGMIELCDGGGFRLVLSQQYASPNSALTVEAYLQFDAHAGPQALKAMRVFGVKPAPVTQQRSPFIKSVDGVVIRERDHISFAPGAHGSRAPIENARCYHPAATWRPRQPLHMGQRAPIVAVELACPDCGDANLDVAPLACVAPENPLHQMHYTAASQRRTQAIWTLFPSALRRNSETIDLEDRRRLLILKHAPPEAGTNTHRPRRLRA